MSGNDRQCQRLDPPLVPSMWHRMEHKGRGKRDLPPGAEQNMNVLPSHRCANQLGAGRRSGSHSASGTGERPTVSSRLRRRCLRGSSSVAGASGTSNVTRASGLAAVPGSRPIWTAMWIASKRRKCCARTPAVSATGTISGPAMRSRRTPTNHSIALDLSSGSRQHLVQEPCNY